MAVRYNENYDQTTIYGSFISSYYDDYKRNMIVIFKDNKENYHLSFVEIKVFGSVATIKRSLKIFEYDSIYSFRSLEK
jgi:hypothetical protein